MPELTPNARGKLAGKVALVTGGAGGLGSAICLALANEGASVVIGYHRSYAAAKTLAANLPTEGATHIALASPVTDSAALITLADEIDRRYGRLDVLVNCAGTTRFVPHPELDQLDDQLIDDILATNIRGPIAMVRAMKTLLQRHADGLVVNISSIAAKSAMGSNIAYCASKAALDNLTKSLARALAPRIRVVSVSPGLVDTEFVKRMDERWRGEQVTRTPLHRLCTPTEVAQAVIACATHFTFSTGSVFAVDGGRALT
ncbi:MAG: SDR family NAD(P)-dependent oxidoreductase [Burkholderiales bacterium]|jgi:3-oxoacyl-[acyl-carrier protein] reductase|nr:SDR family oxidoreductase [Betaproteobacteria bacterium]